MPASTNHLYCPTLKSRIGNSCVPEGVNSIYEIVINGLDKTSLQKAMKAGIEAAAGTGAVMYIGAANYEGTLGEYRFYLYDLFR